MNHLLLSFSEMFPSEYNLTMRSLVDSFQDYKRRLENRLDQYGAGIRQDIWPTVPRPYLTNRTAYSDYFLAFTAYSTLRASTRYWPYNKATLVLAASQLAIFSKPGGVPLKDVALYPCMMKKCSQWNRFLIAPFVSSSALQVASVLSVITSDGAEIEQTLGSLGLLQSVLILGVLSQGLYVALSCLYGAETSYSLGFTGIATALQLIAGYSREERGVTVSFDNGRFGCWASFLWVHFYDKELSILSHICGALAGLAYKSIVLKGRISKRDAYLHAMYGSVAVLGALALNYYSNNDY